jgi:hypothetical protein
MISAKMRGMVYSIYCHHDGYPDHIAPLLLNNYNTQEKIEALIMLGDTSAIYETLEKCDPYTKRGETWEDNAPQISRAWQPHIDYYYEYYWDGEKWLYAMGSHEFAWQRHKSLKPLSTFLDLIPPVWAG